MTLYPQQDEDVKMEDIQKVRRLRTIDDAEAEKNLRIQKAIFYAPNMEAMKLGSGVSEQEIRSYAESHLVNLEKRLEENEGRLPDQMKKMSKEYPSIDTIQELSDKMGMHPTTFRDYMGKIMYQKGERKISLKWDPSKEVTIEVPKTMKRGRKMYGLPEEEFEAALKKNCTLEGVREDTGISNVYSYAAQRGIDAAKILGENAVNSIRTLYKEGYVTSIEISKKNGMNPQHIKGVATRNNILLEDSGAYIEQQRKENVKRRRK